MLRDKSLIPLSHQHHNALALCVQIERSLSGKHGPRWAGRDLKELYRQTEKLFKDEIHYHFLAEEQVVFPIAEKLPGLAPLVAELMNEHAMLRAHPALVTDARQNATELRSFAATLSEHVRKEERILFKSLQQALPSEALQRMGESLEERFRALGLPGATCELRP